MTDFTIHDRATYGARHGHLDELFLAWCKAHDREAAHNFEYDVANRDADEAWERYRMTRDAARVVAIKTKLDAHYESMAVVEADYDATIDDFLAGTGRV